MRRIGPGLVLLAVVAAFLAWASFGDRVAPHPLPPETLGEERGVPAAPLVDATRPSEVSLAVEEAHVGRTTAAAEPEPGPASIEPARSVAPPTVVWCARVLELGTDLPLEDATATTCHPRDHTPDRAVPVATSDPDGFLRLEVPDDDRKTIRIDHPGHVYRALRFEAGHETREQAVTVRLARGATLDVHVVEPSGAPRPDVRIEVEAETDFEVGQWQTGFRQRWVAHTDGEGRAITAGLPANRTLAIALKSDAKTQRILTPPVLEPDEVRAVTWTWGAGCTVDGLVLDAAGEPAAQLELRLLRGDVSAPDRFPRPSARVANATTRRDGTFRFKDLSPGPWWIAPEPGEHRDVLAPERLEVGPLDTQISVTMRMTPGLSIRGHVLDAGGAPVEGLVMTIDGSAQTSCGPDGRFEMGGLAPGTYLLQASGTSMAESDVVSADAGAEDVVLRFPPTGSVVVHVLDVDGTPARDCQVEVLSSRPNGWFWACQGTSPVTLRDLAEGPVTLLASAEGHASEPVEVRVRNGIETPVELTLRAAGTLRLRVASPPDLRFPVFTVHHEGRLARRAPLVPNQDVVLRLPAGTIEIVLHDWETGEIPLDAPRRDVTLEPGTERVVEW